MTKLYSTIFNLVALFVAIYIGVDLFYRVLGANLSLVDNDVMVTEQIQRDNNYRRPPLKDFRVVMDRNIFGSKEGAGEGIKPTDIETLEPTTLKVVLLGTVTGSQQNAVAVIEETEKRKQGLYRVGDSVQDAIVKMILRGKVVLRVGDKDEILTMEESSSRRTSLEEEASSARKRPQPSRPSGRGASITVRRSDVQDALKNINTLLSQVRIRPHFKDGKADGLALSNIKGDSIFAKLGLRDGDIVQGVNDRPIRSPDDIVSFYNKLTSGSPISLQINRRGQERTINYRIR
ncbi:MAG: PDZ domain-containing protein [Deltaproteobacteria bacterium]|nr:MAG: PDZ domain-containing protein [Deltaproteobacteria bacterium]